jgi:transcriptional regulator with XRE-family HTH domain/DNA-binding MarR family transcriptional regulator
MNKPINEKIIELRKARTLTQENLGELLGVTSQAVSKWEKGDTMPDIMLLPKICEIFGVSIDAFLEMPIGSRKESCMQDLAEYAKEVGSDKAIIEAFECCVRGDSNNVSSLGKEGKGESFVSCDRIHIYAKDGIGFITYGEEQINRIMEFNETKASELFEFLGNSKVLCVLKSFDINDHYTEEQIAQKSGVAQVDVNNILFKLMKYGYVECNPDFQFCFSARFASLLMIIAGVYTATEKDVITSTWRNFMP